MTAGEARLGARAADAIRAAIRLAGGREVCFTGTVDAEGVVQGARPVARGDARSVLALPGFARRGEMLVHNHPSGLLEPSNADAAPSASSVPAKGVNMLALAMKMVPCVPVLMLVPVKPVAASPANDAVVLIAPVLMLPFAESRPILPRALIAPVLTAPSPLMPT